MNSTPPSPEATRQPASAAGLRAAPGSANWVWCSNVSFQNIGRRPATCENLGCGKAAVHIIEDINSYSWACADCTPLIPSGKIVWPNGQSAGSATETTTNSKDDQS